MHTDFSGDTALIDSFIDAERCIAELQRGRAIVLTEDANHSQESSVIFQVVQLVETLHEHELETLIATHNCQLLLTRSRALALGLMVDGSAVSVDLAPDTSADTIRHWAGLLAKAVNSGSGQTTTLSGNEQPALTNMPNHPHKIHAANIRHAKAALNLAAHAHVLPAIIMYSTTIKPAGLLEVGTNVAGAFSDQSGKLMKLSSARLPLATAQSVELTVFRERHGNAEHIAITVGEPDFSDTVTVRLHSSCFTGDILGSMKCDCGEQLQRAISSMAAGSGGVILYVSQEGRGIGLSSKLLAYQLQDQGMDTIDANQHLGFEADERNYAAAAYMLDQLGINNIYLMTNNPMKINALRQHGVMVHGRVPSPATINVHNARYLETKRERAGHLSSCKTAG